MTLFIVICGFCNILRDLSKLQFNSALFLHMIAPSPNMVGVSAVFVDYASLHHPLFKLGIWFQTEYLTCCEYVMMSRRLIHEHDIISVRDSHYIG